MKISTASSLIQYFELLAGITGLMCYWKKRNAIWFLFAVFLISLFCMEQLGDWYGRHKMIIQNTTLFKWIIIPSLFSIYHFVYYMILSKKYKTIILTSIILFLFFTVSENLIWKREHFYTISLTMSYGCLSVLTFSMLYFFQLVKSEDLLTFKTSMAFWFCLGLLVFYLGSFPFLTFFNSLAIAKDRTVYTFYRWVFIFLNYIMYLLFTIGFICSKPKQLHL
jgi:hypothetical protein